MRLGSAAFESLCTLCARSLSPSEFSVSLVYTKLLDRFTSYSSFEPYYFFQVLVDQTLAYFGANKQLAFSYI